MRGVVCLGLALVCAGVVSGQDSAPERPHFRQQAVEYVGPGREDPPPANLDHVAIGYFGSDDPQDALGGDPWLATAMAIDEANAAGGYDGLPFRLVPAWSKNKWGTGVAQLSRSVYRDGLWAILGPVDGSATHLAEQIVAKARLPLISAVSTDKTVNLANVAWMFSCLPTDESYAGLLAPEVVREAGFTMVSATDHDSQQTSRELLESLAHLGVTPRLHLQVDPGVPVSDDTVERLLSTPAGTVVVLAGAQDSARMVLALRKRDPQLRVAGGPSMGRRVFAEQAGAAAEGVLFSSPCDPAVLDGPFARAFRERFGRSPDCATAQAYDAARLLVAAIRDAGLNRARIRDSLSGLAPWDGAAGRIEWGPLGRNLRAVHLATIRDGRVVLAP